MKIARILHEGEIKCAIKENDGYFLIESGDCFDIKRVSHTKITGDIKLLAPVVPSKIIALGANYRDHAKELNLSLNPVPLIFFKPPTSVIGHDEYIVLPPCSQKVDYEAELAVIIGKDCKNISEEEAESVILGFTCANDVTERVFQKMDGQWARAKGFDTFCPLGPYIQTDLDYGNVELKAILNGKTVQRGNTLDMIYGVKQIVSFASQVMTLKKGDAILTGTPEGIGQIKNGDTIEIEIQGIGKLRNFVKQG
ncbi:MAG TPA: fumarylacetoacetate hydrolase family protein [Clostridiales bacterium]|jgi:2-keto-4-pentenoate hydratase/2-oxohepta-3-ene-1,7-dioic acid hydratase in catechol pathway|nr:fumarylacetoacetate hydrolase family protein [Clostridiales bacterium]